MRERLREARTCDSFDFGGADSDCLLDLCERVRRIKPIEVRYVWFDTGLEYAATKRHLDWLERRYGIEIIRYRAKKSIPTCVREFGQPFVSKYASENIERLQRHGFQWEDEPLDVLTGRYDRCRSALMWWTNSRTRNGVPGYFDIGRVRHLKEFITENHPWFRISNQCCLWTKKKVSVAANRELGADLELTGIRRSEGGARKVIGTCFTSRSDGADTYRPLLWFSDADKADYCRIFGIRHSDCYTVWGFERTGCVGCPFNPKVAADLDVARVFEPKLVAAAESVFSDSYEYTRAFREFQRSRSTGQLTLDLRHARARTGDS